MVTIVAPAGYGKTTLSAEWARRDDRPFAWAGEDVTPERLLDDAAASRMPQVIVLDDAQHLDAERVRDLLRAAERMPPGVTFALLSRSCPGAPLGRLRAQGLVVELSARELAMTGLEASRLLEKAGVTLDRAQAELLMERTEGWPAALYLAALSLREGGTVADFTGADRLVADYLEAALLAGLGERTLAFLRRTSILPTLSGPLCDAVLDRSGSGAALRDLARAGLPLEPLDRCDTAWRAHPLLAQALRAELGRREPRLAGLLHARAVDCHAAAGETGDAIRHAAACRDAERAGELLWSVTPDHAAAGDEPALGAWLALFSEHDVATHPALAACAALHHLAAGRRRHAERCADAVERLAPGWAAVVAVVRAGCGRGGPPQMAADALRAAERSAPDSPLHSMSVVLAGAAHQLAGDLEAARPLLERATAAPPAVAALAHAQLALLAIRDRDWPEADRLAREAHALIAPAAGARPVRALVLAVYAAVAVQRGEIAQARHDAADALRLLRALEDCPAWLAAEVHVWLAQAEIRLSDGPTARNLLAGAARLEPQVAGAVALSAWVHDGWERADALAASATGDGPNLTNAELRVLRMLPSHMSFREIGERLHVSTNTVKTQALAVYRKLDVSCRSDAVQRGRVTGLVDGS